MILSVHSVLLIFQKEVTEKKHELAPVSRFCFLKEDNECVLDCTTRD
jgi:hypothetical protein